MALFQNSVRKKYIAAQDNLPIKVAFTKVRTNQLARLPIVDAKPEMTKRIADLVSTILDANQQFVTKKQNTTKFIKAKLPINDLSTKLQNWPSLDFKGFLAELKKAKVKLSLAEEAEWMAYFNEQKTKAQDLQAEITCLDREIDQLVYELTTEEIGIVEGGEM